MIDLGPRVTREESAPLVHALAARAAADLGVRALALKGPVLSEQGLRPPRQHADIDILVAPGDLHRLAEGMRRLGWREGLVSTAPTIMPVHSVNLLGDNWPLTIDLHHYFPGFLAPADEVFENLWSRHVTVDLAGVPVPTLDPVAHAAVAALHLLRDQRSAVSRVQLADLSTRASRVLDQADLADLAELAVATQAPVTLRPFLRSLGIDVEALGDASDAEGVALWNLRVTARESDAWIHHLRRTPLRRWPRTVWRALVLTDEEIRTFHAAPHEEASLLRPRWRRIRRGLLSVPRSLIGAGLDAARRTGGKPSNR